MKAQKQQERIPSPKRFEQPPVMSRVERIAYTLKKAADDRWLDVVNKAYYAARSLGNCNCPHEVRAKVLVAMALKEIGNPEKVWKEGYPMRQEILELIEESKKPIPELADNRAALAMKIGELAPKADPSQLHTLEQNFLFYLGYVYPEVKDLDGTV